MEKLLIYAHYTLASGWCSCFLNGKCIATWWPNLAFHCLFWRVIVSSSFLCGVWWYMMVELLLVVIFFPFFCLRKCTTVFLALCVSISILILLICYFVIFFYNFFFNLILQLQFLICYFLHLGSYSFDS